jgi:hypothetical protein
MNTIVLIETPFELARDLVALAFRLDEGKFAFPGEMHAEMLYVAEVMYDAAETLAGQRKDELYPSVRTGDAKEEETHL